MSEIASLGYVGFGVGDLDRWERLAVEVLGLQAGHRDGGQSLALRMDDHEQRIVLTQSDVDDLQFVGWMFDTEEDLEGYVARLTAAGTVLTRCSAEVAALRRVEKLYACEDPDGLQHEFACGPKFAAAPFASPVVGGRFVTGRLGLGHVLVVARDYARTQRFIRDVLGLRITDRIRAPLETPKGTIEVDATFFHARTGRHHSIATAQIPVPSRIHHLMIEVDTLDDVGFAYDRCVAAGFPIGMTIGHHPNDRMVSFYVRTPSGFLIEYGCNGLVIDDRDWEVKTYSQLSDWGHVHG